MITVGGRIVLEEIVAEAIHKVRRFALHPSTQGIRSEKVWAHAVGSLKHFIHEPWVIREIWKELWGHALNVDIDISE